jgi:hypothetical protein
MRIGEGTDYVVDAQPANGGEPATQGRER